jgi:hypothetical protein
MNIVDRQAIEDLFTRLKDAEARGGARDADAEALIAKLVARQPAAAYYLAQTVLVQQWALNAAHDHIEDLERSGGGGGILSAIFGGRGRGPRSSAPAPRAPVNPPRGIGFLEGASQTALGVAGGFILADMLSQANFNDSALAASFTPDAPADAGFGGMGGDFGGGDFGGDGGGGGE